MQTGELDAVLLLGQELYNGFLFILYILFHFKMVTFILANLGDKFKVQYKNFPTLREIIPVILLYIYAVYFRLIHENTVFFLNEFEMK